MATYLPNVNKYVSKTESFTPDFKFLSDALAKRQDRYDTNYKKMNNLYGSVIHADLSREDNRGIRDTYAEELAPKLQQISGVDFSLQQNVDSAKALFTPFFEDEKIVRDIVFTKRFKTEQQRFEGWRNSEEEETRKKYWDGGVQALNYSMADFQNATREGSMQVQLPEAVEHVNLVEIGISKLKDLGMDVTDVSMSKDGNYQITQRNGTLLTRRAIGKDKDDNTIYTNPAQEYILQTTLDDPRVIRFYETKFYVKARQFYEQNAEKYGGEEAAEKVFYEQMLSDYNVKHSEEKDKKESELTSALEAKNDWEAYKAKHGDFVIGSEEHRKYAQAYNEYIALANGRKLKDKKHALITAESKGDINDLRMKAANAFMQYNIDADTRKAAAFYADINSERKVEADKFALQNHKAMLDARLNEQDAANKRIQTAFEKGYVINEDGSFTTMPWAEGGGNPANTNQRQIFGDNFANDAEAGDGSTTSDSYGDDDGIKNVIAENSNHSNNKIEEIKGYRWNSIENFYQSKSTDVSDDDNTYSSEGMKINGEFMTWADAKEYYMKPENKAEFKALYDKVHSVYKNENTGPSLQSSNPQLYEILHTNAMKIDAESVKLLAGWEEQRKVYQNVISLLAAEGDINSVQLKLLDAYPILNSRGEIQDPQQIVGKMNTDFTNWFSKAIAANELPFYKEQLSDDPAVLKAHGEVAETFGFKDVNALYDAIYPWNYTYGDHRLASEAGEQKRYNANITAVSKKHFKNIYDEFIGKDDAQSLFDDVVDKMNRKMQSASAVPGVMNFNMASYLTNQDQTGIGGTIFPIHPADYIHGQVNTKANQQLALINSLMKGPKQNYSIVAGDASAAYDGVTNPDAQLVLESIFRDLRKTDPKAFTKGEEPHFTIRWAEALGGEEGKGEHGGWVITLQSDYALTKKSTSKSGNNKLVPAKSMPGNSITVFAPREFSNQNPMSVQKSFTSVTDYLVNVNKTRIIDNDGGRVKFFRGSDGLIRVQERVAYYDKNKDGGSVVLSPYTTPRIIQASGVAIDEIFNEYDRRLRANIKVVNDARNAHKKEQNNNSQQ